jgi:Leucine-rich repeat (LRR) protein
MSSTETDPSLPVLQLSSLNQAVPVGKSSSREATEAATGDSVPTPLERQGTISSDLSELQRTRLDIFEADKDLQDLCRDNGLTASQFAKKAPTVATLVTFLGFWPNMKSVMHFSALRELSIVKHPTISRIEGLESCPNLEQLTITECGITQIENLEACRKLKKLNLSSNNIQSMEPVSMLDALEELWLCDNSIERLEGLWRATKLTTLWVCRNRIERIDSALNACVNLVELNLADNRIFSFKSLLSLANLDQLSVLTLSDPHYGENPVCRLCNYQTYVMCQLTRLSWLDTVELSSRTKQIAEATMLKKKMYYNMRIKCMKRDAHHRIRRANDVRRNHEQHIEMNISALARHKKEIEQALLDLACEEMGKMDDEEAQSMRDKLRAIDEYLTEKCGTMARMNQDFDRVQTRLEWAADVNISRLLLELDTGGNIRLEDGSPSDAWYASCVDLIKSRLFAADLRPFGVSDVRITRVTRINNRYLRNRFHARMEEILVVNENQVKDNVSKKGVTVSAKDSDEDGVGNVEDTLESVAGSPGSVPENSLEYLFYSQPPMMEYMHKPEPDQFHAAEYGFRDPREYQAMGLDGAVKLSNSIALLETSRLLASFASKSASLQKHELSGQSAMKYSTLSVHQQETELRTGFTREMRDAAKLASQGVWDVPGGTLLVVKVFPGYTKTILDSEAVPSPIDRRDHMGFHSLQVMKSSHLQNTNVTTEAPQKMYYVFDKTLVLPEYLVEYQYITSTQLATAMEAVLAPESELKSACADPSGLGAAVAMADDYERRYRIRRPPSPEGTEDTVPSTVSILDDAVLKLLETGHRTGFASSSEAMLPMTRVNLVETGRLRQLHLIGCGMEIMPDLSVIGEVLEVLVLAYNRIPQLDASLHVLTKLTRLDVSSNRLLRIEYIDSLTSLVDLDASYNQIQTFDDLIRFPPACKSPLRRVNLRKNPICSAKRYRLRMLRAAGSSLEVLDEQGVCRDEFIASQRLLTKLSAEVLWARYQFTKDAVTPRNVRGKEHGSRAGKVDGQHCWTAVEELMLARELISCIEGLEPFVNLRIMSLADNAVRHIGGLHKCTRLEELNLEDNELTKVENLSSLSSLKRLNIARNRLTSIDHLETLENLTQLSLEDNQITSLRGLASAMKLMELYVGNNRIESLKEIQHLKALPKLTILDLSGNDIARLPDYRLYTVYYLRRVKVLDGVSVSPQDQSEAKHKYSGKLTLEFIAEKCGGSNFERLQELDLSSCRIRELGTIHGKSFPNLRDLNLENNQIGDILGLDALPKLRILNLNRNRIERLLLNPNAAAVPEAADSKGILGCTKLEQLFLAYNQINDMTALGFQHLDSLRVSHLRSNTAGFSVSSRGCDCFGRCCIYRVTRLSFSPGWLPIRSSWNFAWTKTRSANSILTRRNLFGGYVC